MAGANDAISIIVFAISSSKDAKAGRTGARPSKIISVCNASSNVASSGVMGAKAAMVRIETVDSVISSNVATAGTTGASMLVFNEAASLLISFESESVDANMVFTDKRNIPVKIRVWRVLIAFILFFFEIDEAKIYRNAGEVDKISIDATNLPSEGGK